MRITDLLNPVSIDLNGSPENKETIINKMVSLMEKSGNLRDTDVYRAGVFKREEESTTGIGDGIAIPHCKSDAVIKPGLAAMVVRDGTDFEALDDEKVHLIFLIAAPNTKENVHLDVLSKLSALLMDEDFTEKLKNAGSTEEFLSIINEAEDLRDEEENESAEIKPQQSGKMILAVTGCPTGIAHTYMAAEALEKKAKEMGYFIKVETRGSGGAKNVLTEEEIAKADGIIVAADTKVPMDRFNGKKVVEVPVSDGISKPEALINRVLSDNVPLYKGSAGSSDKNTHEEKGSKSGIAHSLYKHLMNGVSYMLPFVVGGGILIAIAFLLDDYSINPANFGKNTPIAAWFKTIGDMAFGFMLPVLAGFIAMSIADRPGLVVGFVGGYLASIGTTFQSVFTGEATVPAGFLGALIAGFAGGLIVVFLKKICSCLPDSLEGIKPVLIYPLAGIALMAVFMCAINPFVGILNTGLINLLNSMGGSSKVLLGCVLGAMMSIDMGGPFNKAAYVFGSGMLAEQTDGGFMIMAAVMAGGMIPPLAVALSATLFKKKYTSEERKSAPVNYIMGLCFISEGAIPFAAADPIRVIPSCMAGSAVAGGLSMAFSCTLRAPHGGIFVLPTMGNIFGYVIALVAGTVVAAVLMGILKKNKEI